MNDYDDDGEHFDDDELIICDDCGSNNIAEIDEGMTSIMFCVDCGAVHEF